MSSWGYRLGVWWRWRRSLGGRGERTAARHLKATGYRILARNLRTRFGEIDLIAQDTSTGCIVVVEVKTGSSEDPPPEVHLNHRKQKKLGALALALVRRYGLDDQLIRFDLVAIVWPADCRRPARVTHHVAAFESLV